MRECGRSVTVVWIVHSDVNKVLDLQPPMCNIATDMQPPLLQYVRTVHQGLTDSVIASLHYPHSQAILLSGFGCLQYLESKNLSVYKAED